MNKICQNNKMLLIFIRLVLNQIKNLKRKKRMPEFTFHITREMTNSLIIIIVSFVVIYASSYFIKKQEWNKIKKKTYLSFIRNLALILSLFLLFFTWRGEIKTFILSISAITVGLFVVFKDVILSFFSYFIISSNQLLKIGDVIEIEDKIGKVIDRTLLYTKISLVGTNHSKELVIPNSAFASGKFVNLSTNAFYSKSFTLLMENLMIRDKVSYVHEIVVEEIGAKNYTYDTYIDTNTAREVSLKIVVKNIEEDFDFNKFKNNILIKFLNKWPSQLAEDLPSVKNEL